MPSYLRCRGTLCVLALATFALVLGGELSAARAAESGGGFATVVRPDFNGEEIRAHTDLWGLEIAFKPMRTVFVQVANPRTGAKSSEMVWYLVYRIVNRPVARPAETSDLSPINVEDSPPPPTFVPSATLVTEDRDLHKAYVDSIVPEALQAILARERLDLKTTVQMTGDVPKPTAAGSAKENVKYGVFMFRGVDPRTTAFAVYVSGLTNAYKIGKDESGKPLILRRTLVVPYRRPADEFDQFEREIRQVGEPKWVYVPAQAPAVSN